MNWRPGCRTGRENRPSQQGLARPKREKGEKQNRVLERTGMEAGKHRTGRKSRGFGRSHTPGRLRAIHRRGAIARTSHVLTSRAAGGGPRRGARLRLTARGIDWKGQASLAAGPGVALYGAPIPGSCQVWAPRARTLYHRQPRLPRGCCCRHLLHTTAPSPSCSSAPKRSQCRGCGGAPWLHGQRSGTR